VSNRSSFIIKAVRSGHWTTCALGLTCLAALIVACYGEVLFGGGQFAFRDSANFYYPLYARVQQEWSAGRLPLWEPGENGGTPMLGSPMAAVLYPGKFLFALVPYAWGVRLYTVAHTVLAFGAMVALTRSWGVSRTGAALAGLSYAFGGPVLSDYFNIIYLVGAAWVPLGLRAADRWLRLGCRSALAELALVLAMQVLGGDPEAAYITVLCALGYAVALARAERAATARAWRWGLGAVAALVVWTWAGPHLAPRIHGSVGLWGHAILAAVWALGITVWLASLPREQRVRWCAMIVGLAGSCALAITLTAMQTFPVLEQIATSVRGTAGGPADVYDFSLEPYRAFEWLWPNVFGTFTAGNRYWILLLPPVGAHRAWPLSLYMGALPLVLALSAAGLQHRPPWCAWMTTIAFLSFWASLGEFAGPARWSGGEPSPVGGDGSFYGLLATLVPGLRLFRFPCKLLIFTAVAMSALAGVGWDRVASGAGRRRVVAGAIVLLVLTVLSAALAAGLHGRLVATMAVAGQSIEGVLGPFDAPGALAELFRGLGHGAAALALSLTVVVWSTRRPGVAALVALPLLAADLAVASARLVITVPQAEFEREPELVRAIRAAESAHPSSGPFRVHRLSSWIPIGWSRAKSTRRLQDFVSWEIDTLQPGFGLLHGVSYVLTGDSQTGRADFRPLFRPSFRPVGSGAAAALGAEPGRRVLYHPRRAFDLWGARYFILPSYPGNWTSDDRGYAAFVDQTELIYPDPAALAGPDHRREREHWLETKDVQVRRNRAAFPRAWVVHDARLIRPQDGEQPTRDTLLERLRFADPLARSLPAMPAVDLRDTAYIETDDPAALSYFLPGAATDEAETVTVRYNGPSRVVLDARLRRPGIIVLADVLDDGWQLDIDGKPSQVLRANLLMRGAAVTAGTHTLVYTYRPASVRLGAWVSGAGLVTLIGLAVWAYPRRMRMAASLLDGASTRHRL
jgi:hypothetical protein